MRVLMTDIHLLRDKKKSGVGYYTQELKRALLAKAGPEFVFSFPTFWLYRKQEWLNRQCLRYETVAKRTGMLARIERELRGRMLNAVRAAFPIMKHPYLETLRRTGCTVYHEPNFIACELDLPTVVSVHDLSAVLHPEWHPPDRVRVFEKGFRKGLEYACHLIAISEFGKGELVRHLGWPPERVSVTYMGVRPGLHRIEGDARTAVLRKLKLEPGYLLHVGTLEPRKNLPMLLRAYSSLPSAVRESHPLALAGGPGWNSGELHDYLKSEGRDLNIRWLGYVKDEHFAALYSGARALVFPTFYEGFGMPTVEMMACGGAVLASTAGAVAETAGEKAQLIDPRDEAGWRDAMLRVCTDNDWWRTLRDGAEDAARPYTWARCAEDTIAAYQRATGQQRLSKQAA